jgi:hypothetical protein
MIKKKKKRRGKRERCRLVLFVQKFSYKIIMTSSHLVDRLDSQNKLKLPILLFGHGFVTTFGSGITRF